MNTNNQVVMVPAGKLKLHPKNPRKDLGDLTELSDSIKKNGIMQNLTAVPDPEDKDSYKIIDFLKETKKTCEQRISCSGCFLEDGSGNCIVCGLPDHWRI